MTDRTIWKYPFSITDRFTLDMPEGAQILTIQNQQDTATLWALVNPQSPRVTRHFIVVGTGHPISLTWARSRYLGTVQQYDGHLVWHIFEGDAVPTEVPQ